MTREPYGITTFCDDIRHEINGKMTLVGCYAKEMLFSGPPPGLLSNFCALVNIRIPKGIPFSKFTIRILLENGSGLTEISSAHLDGVSNSSEAETTDGKAGSSQILSVSFPFQWQGLLIDQNSIIKVRAYLDDNFEILAGALEVKFSDEYKNESEETPN